MSLGRVLIGPIQAELKELFKNLHRPYGVGVGQSTAPDGTKPEPGHLGILMGENTFDGADGVVSGELTEQKRPEPAPAVKTPRPGVAVVAGDDRFEFGTGDELNDLGKNGRRSQSLKPRGK